MAEEFVRYFDVDGEKRPLAASNLKKSGRLVIGISGTHTPDDADILFGANEADGAENSAKLEAAIQKGGFGELFFLNGSFYVANTIDTNKLSLISGCNSQSTSILYTGPFIAMDGAGYTIRDLEIGATNTRKPCGVSTEYAEGDIIIENVMFTGFDNAVYIEYCTVNLIMSKCRITDCNDAFYISAAHAGFSIVENCEITNCTNVCFDFPTDAEDKFTGNFVGSCETVLIGNPWAEHNQNATNNTFYNNGSVTTKKNSTTIGATKLTEDKVKVLNRLDNDAFQTIEIEPTSDGTYVAENDLNGVYIVQLEDRSGGITWSTIAPGSYGYSACYYEGVSVRCIYMTSRGIEVHDPVTNEIIPQPGQMLLRLTKIL